MEEQAPRTVQAKQELIEIASSVTETNEPDPTYDFFSLFNALVIFDSETIEALVSLSKHPSVFQELKRSLFFEKICWKFFGLYDEKDQSNLFSLLELLDYNGQNLIYDEITECLFDNTQFTIKLLKIYANHLQKLDFAQFHKIVENILALNTEGELSNSLYELLISAPESFLDPSPEDLLQLVLSIGASPACSHFAELICRRKDEDFESEYLQLLYADDSFNIHYFHLVSDAFKSSLINDPEFIGKHLEKWIEELPEPNAIGIFLSTIPSEIFFDILINFPVIDYFVSSDHKDEFTFYIFPIINQFVHDDPSFYERLPDPLAEILIGLMKSCT